MEQQINWIVENWTRIPDKFKSDIKPSYRGGGANVEGLALEEHIVVLLIDRQKPSVEVCYSFDEERLGVTSKGKIIWGFDSGCSCPSPWSDNYPKCYCVAEGWKQFEVNVKDFDPDWEQASMAKIAEIKNAVENPVN